MYKSCVMFCRFRFGVYNTNCIDSRTFSVISQKANIDGRKKYGHGISYIPHNQMSTHRLHMVARPPLFLKYNTTNSPYLKPQIRHASIMENYFDFLYNNAIVKVCEDCLLYLHDASGLPWWVNIVFTALFLNLSLNLPLKIFAMKNKVKLGLVYEKLLLSAPQFERECTIEVLKKKLGPQERRKLVLKKLDEKKRELFIEDNCHPAKELVVTLAKLPFLLAISFAYRNLSGTSIYTLFSDSGARSPELITEGILWFQNLAVPDPYYILPVIFGIVSLNRDYAISKEMPKEKKPGLFKYILPGTTIVMTFIASVCPSCMVLYWTCHGICGTIIGAVCKLPQVKMFFNIPVTPVKTNSFVKRLVKALNESKK